LTYWSTLWRIELRALLVVLVCAVLVAIYGAVDGVLNAPYQSAAANWAWIGFAGTMIFGFPVAALYGAPLYVFLMRNLALTWPRVLLVGALPSALVAILDREMAPLFLICGVFVAAGIHALSHLRPLTMRWSGP
jgi:hypothetical protein